MLPHKSHKQRGARLGQHFLTRTETARQIVEDAAISHEDTVVEIGPGKGILTHALLERAKRVIAVEKDPLLATHLRTVFAQEVATGQLTLIEQDIRDIDLDKTPFDTPYKLVANIPYYITGHILRMFLSATHQPTTLTVLIQKEVAERIIAKNGKESLLSLSVKLFGVPSIRRIVKAGAFSPPPQVDSAVLHVAQITHAALPNSHDRERFFALLHRAFSGKRKQIGTTLRSCTAALLSCDISPKTRPEDIPLNMWIQLSKKTARMSFDRDA